MYNPPDRSVSAHLSVVSSVFLLTAPHVHASHPTSGGCGIKISERRGLLVKKGLGVGGRPLLSHQAGFRHLCLLLSSPRPQSAPTPPVGAHAAEPGTWVPRTHCARGLRPRIGRANYPDGQRCPFLQNPSQPPRSRVWTRVRKSVLDQDK